MLAEFCTFTLDSGEEVRINALQVRCITAVAHPPETWSRIEFDQNHYIIVTAPPSEVEHGLTTEDE